MTRRSMTPRFVMTLVRSAVSYGAAAANHVSVIGYLHDGDQVTGVHARGRDHR
jgi:glycerol-3-phosphate dehydrogenase